MDDSLEKKFRLMTMLPFDKRLKRRHWAVYGFMLDWYHRKYGDALASVRHIAATLKERDPAGVGFYIGDVHSALTDLVAWGYLEQQKGTGRLASRYIPIWSKFDSVRETPNTSDDELAFGKSPNTDVRETPNTTADSVRETPNEDPLTGPGLQTGGHVVGRNFEAAPTAPPRPGLDGRPGAVAASGGGEGEDFSSFWSAWPRKHGKKKAETEWKRIDASLRGAVVVAAGKWADHYSTHGVDMRWIPEPANWLKDERWDEDLPLIHIDAKGAAIAKAKANAPAKPEPATTNEPPEPANENIPDWMRGSPKLWPIGRHYGEFIDGEVVKQGGDTEVLMTFRRDDGTILLHHFYTEAFIKSFQDAGQAALRDIIEALGMSNCEDTDELLFKPLAVTADGETLTYSSISEAA